MKKFVALALLTAMSLGISSTIFASEQYFPKTSEMTAQEIKIKKEQVRVPDTISSAIGNYVESEDDIWSVIANNLDGDEYGGMYVLDGILHIKTVGSESVVEDKINEILAYVSRKLRTSTNNIIIETDALYTIAELEDAIDKLWTACDDGLLDIVGMGTLDDMNGILVEAPEWTNEKKRLVSDITSFDFDHIDFKVNDGDFRDLAGYDIGTPGITIENDMSGSRYSLGVGVYYEINGDTTGEYGWITAGHGCADGDHFYLERNYMGFVDFINIGVIGSNKYAYADVAAIYRPEIDSEVIYTNKTSNGKYIVKTSTAIKGDSVCVLGGKSGIINGEIISANYTCKWTGGQGTYKKMIKTDIQSKAGDSGAPLVRIKNNGDYELLGILKGVESDNEAIFTSWDSIESRLIYSEKRMVPIEMWLWP